MPKVDIWMPVFIGDYLGDTIELSAEEHGAYLLLLMHYWLKKGEIGDDITRLSRVCKVDEKTCSFILGYYFTHEEGNYRNKRADIEMENAEARRLSSSENGKKGGRPPKNNLEKTGGFHLGIPRSNLEESSSPPPPPSSSQVTFTNKQEEPPVFSEASQEEYREEESGAFPIPEPNPKRPKSVYNPNDLGGAFETVRNHWNGKPGIPAFTRLFLNMFPEEREAFTRMMVHGVDKLCEAIDNYGSIIDNPGRYGFDTRYAFKSLPNFLKAAEKYFDPPREAKQCKQAPEEEDFSKYNALMRKE